MTTYMQGGGSSVEADVDEGLEDIHTVKPKYYNVPGLSSMFGFEVGKPAYPAYDDSWKKLVALESDATGLLSKLKSHRGLIIWEMFKPLINSIVPNEASTKYIN